jgi:dihydrofolate reductase
MPGTVRVFIATSLDGFIAGPGDDLSWLPHPTPGEDYGYADHVARTAAILMGRRSYDAVAAFDGDWPYGDTPVFVATARPLDPVAPTVHAVTGDTAADLLAAVQAQVGDGGIYVDGGALIRSLLDAGLVDELVVTIVPVILGAGIPLFAGAAIRHELELVGSEEYDTGLVQLRYLVLD